MLRSVLIVVGLCALSASAFPRPYPRRPVRPVNGTDFGEPLYLTEYITSGNIAEGRLAAQVNLPDLPRPVESYAGFLTVDEKYNSNIYFWYFVAENSPQTAPVVVWLQGGPGASSLYAIFEEHGPYFVSKAGGLQMRPYYWSKYMHVIYIDNPVGTGFSFTNSDDGYAKSQVDVGRNLYRAITQFFQLFPDLQRNDFFVTGESYGGKYVPAMAYTIHKNNPKSSIKVNLKGLAIGNGLSDPEGMLVYSDYLYNLGLIDIKVRGEFKKTEAKVKSLIQKGKYLEADRVWDAMLNGDLTPYKTLFYNSTRFNVYFNYLHTDDYELYGDYTAFLTQDTIRKQIHVGNLTFSDENLKVEKALLGDMMRSVKPWLQTLMDNYKVLLYNGQLDIICAYPLTMNYVHSLKWKGADDYKAAKRQPWYVGEDIAGYVKHSGNFTEALVRNAGHMVPQDQPEWALDLLKNFVFNKW